MPRVDEILGKLGGARFFSTLDLASGYWQVPLREEDIPKTAFSWSKSLRVYRYALRLDKRPSHLSANDDETSPWDERLSDIYR